MAPYSGLEELKGPALPATSTRSWSRLSGHVFCGVDPVAGEKQEAQQMDTFGIFWRISL